MKKLRLLSCIVTIALGVSFAVPSFALEAAYWLRGTTDWGDFGVAQNWAIGSSESEVHAVPGMSEYVHLDGNRMFDLGGGTYAVGGLSPKGNSAGGNECYSTWVTNGTLTVEGFVLTTSRLKVFDGGTLILKAADAGRSWGQGNGFFIDVHRGGTVEERKNLTFQQYRVTIDEGGTFVLDPTNYGPHPTGLSASWYKNSGFMYLPHGITRNYGWDEGTASKPASETYYQYAGTMKIGGPVSKGRQASQPMRFEFHGGTLEAENAVTFANDVDLVRFMEGSAMAVKVDASSSLDLANVTFADDATITKTGPGKLILRDAAVPSLVVAEGVVEVRSDSVAPTTASFAADTTLRLTVSGFRMDSVTAYAGMRFEIDPSVCIAGAGVLYSSDAAFLAYAKDAIAPILPPGFDRAIIGDVLMLTQTSDYMFDASKSSDLSDPTAWKGNVVPVGEDVIVGGEGTVTFTAGAPAFKSISVQEGATLKVVGGSEESPVDLPKLALNYQSRLLVATDAVAQITNEFTTVGDAKTLPILEVATNALLIAQTPNAPAVKSAQDKWSYHSDHNLGVTWKNLALRWYGTIRMFHSDVADRAQHCHLYLGYAAEKETSYISIDCQGGVYHAAGEGNAAGRCMTGLIVAVPDNDTTDSKDQGGRVVPVGTLRFRDYTFRHQPSVSLNPAYASPGLFIGTCSPWYTGNPASIEFDVVFEGDTVIQTKGIFRIGGGAHVTLRGPAKWRYDRTAYNDKDGPFRYLDLRDEATIAVEDGAEFDFCAVDSTNSGILLGNSTLNDVAFSIRNATMSLFSWSGAGNDRALVENALLRIGVNRSTNMLKYRTDVFAGFGSVGLDGNGLTVSAADIWSGAYESRQWNRLVTIGPKLTGAGGLAVSNELSGANAAYSMTLVVTNGANEATGLAQVLATDTGAPANLVFADGANWAGTVVANAGLSLTNLTDGAAAATVSFGAVRGVMPIRVWKTGGVIAANDRVNLATAGGAFDFIAMDEALAVGDAVELGLYPANAPLPANARHVEYFATEAEGAFVTLWAKRVKPGMLIFVR